MRRTVLGLVVAVAVLGAVALATGEPAAPAPAPSIADGIAAFHVVYGVLESPRCRNCHPAGDAPLQFDDGRPHAMNITRRSERNGVACATCHGTRNGTRPGQPPGAPNWHLPPPAMPMVFEGRTESQLCRQLRDPTQTGGRDVDAVVEHVATDPLVGWGWAPGPGRKPVAVPRAEVVGALKTWVSSGAPCD
jgi:hypothetical protein